MSAFYKNNNNNNKKTTKTKVKNAGNLKNTNLSKLCS